MEQKQEAKKNPEWVDKIINELKKEEPKKAPQTVHGERHT